MTEIKSFITKIKENPDAYLLALLVFLLPFERIPSYHFHGVTLRLSLFVAAFIIIRALYFLLSKKKKLAFSWQVKFLFIFLTWITLLLPVAINTSRALSVIIFTAFTIFTALSIVVLYKKEYLPVIFKGLLFSSLIVVIFGIYQYFGNIFGLSNSLTGLRDRYSWEIFGFPRIQSTTLEPLFLAAYLLLPISILSAGIILKKGTDFINRHKKLSIFTLYLLALSVFLTLSRGGVSAMIIAAAVTLILAGIFRLLKLKKMVLITIIFLAGFITSLLIINYFNKASINNITGGKRGLTAYGNQIKNTGLEGSGDERAVARKEAIDLIKQGGVPRLLLGVGPGNFGPHIQNNTPIDNGWIVVNNETLELVVETGLIGLIIFAAFVISLLISSLKKIRREKDPRVLMWLIGLSAFLIAIIWQYQTFSTLYIMHIWVAIGLLMGIGRLSQE